MAYQRTKNFERLSFLYLITGNIDKLKKMLKISEMRGDVMSRFHNSLYLGDVHERIKILEEVGQGKFLYFLINYLAVALAYATAITHGLKEEAEAIAAKFPGAAEIHPLDSALLLHPPIPIMKLHESNWPLLTVSKGYFDGTIGKEEEKKLLTVEAEDEPSSGWGEDLPDEEKTATGEDTIGMIQFLLMQEIWLKTYKRDQNSE
jgi:coatomer protein complex subunit alpha (xenin)